MKEIYVENKEGCEERKKNNTLTDSRNIKRKFIRTDILLQKTLADALQCDDGSVKKKKKPLLTIDSVLRNAKEAKNDLKLAETFLSLRPMPDHDPRLVSLAAVRGHQSEDIIYNASNAIDDSESPLPSTPESTHGSDSYHEIPSPELMNSVPRDDDVAKGKQIIDLTQHRMTSILSEEESSDEKEDVVLFRSII